jgi:hypothetical protein
MEEHEPISQKDLDAFGLEDSSFIYTTAKEFEDEQILFEEYTCKKNVVQTRSQLTKAPLKGPRQPNEQAKFV